MLRAFLLTVAIVLALTVAPARADVVWLCEPGVPENPCTIPQDTTVQTAGQPDEVVTPPNGAREIDCFYVYPTVSNQLTPNATKARDPELESIASYQAARFNQQCRIFAPIYRQATLAAIATGYLSASGADRELAYGDVLEAWRDYVRNDNEGRGVVLIGHSQGTGVLRRLLRNEIETHPAQHRRLVGALLLGGNVTVADGRVVGGDFTRTPLCERQAQVGCVVAFSTFYEDPPANARFGRSNPPPENNPSGLPGGSGFEVACTDPRPLAGMTDPFRLLIPTEPFAPGPLAAGVVLTANGAPPTAATTWVTPPDRGEGACARINGAHVLRIEPLEGSRRPVFFPEPTWGTHLIDVNVALDPLVSLVGQQARRWTHPELALRLRCRAGRVRPRIAGAEREFVRTVAYKRGKRAVRAVVRLGLGAARRVVLKRAKPRCGAPARAAQAAASIDLVDFKPPKHLVADGTSTFEVRARLDGIDAADTVILAGDAAAYDVPVWAVRDTATRSATTTFTVAPSATATYTVQALVDNRVVARSRPFTVVAHPLVTLRSKQIGGGLELRTTARLHRGKLPFRPRAGSAKEVAFYYRLDGSDVYKQLTTVELSDKGCCARTATHTMYDQTLLAGIRTFRVCFPGRIFAGAGEPARCPPKLSA